MVNFYGLLFRFDTSIEFESSFEGEVDEVTLRKVLRLVYFDIL